jgi:hypothetical protein
MTTEPESVEELHEEQPAVEEATEVETEAEQAEEPARPKKSAKERIDELTAARRQAERDAEYWREQALNAFPAPAPQPVQGKPTLEHFEDYDTFVEALTDWKAEQAVARTITEREQRTTQQSRLSTFEQRIAAQFPDGEPEGIAALKRAPVLSEAITDVILATEAGPKLADYLGSNPRELQRLSALPPSLQAYELAKLESQMSAAPRPTNAPEPSPTLRGAGGKFKVDPATADFTAFERQYGG